MIQFDNALSYNVKIRGTHNKVLSDLAKETWD